MLIPSPIVPLNLLVEFLSECADVIDFDALLRVVGGRVRWIVEFDHCTLALQRGEQRAYWTVTRGDDSLRAVAAAEVPAAHATLLDAGFDSGAPGSSGLPVSALCAPLFADNAVFGAICFSCDRGSYTYRDSRFVYHVAQCVSSTVTRLDLTRRSDEESRRKDAFLALLSHELRNPLAPIMTAVHLLKLDSLGPSAREVEVIERQASHLLRLVDDLLDISRATRGQMILHRAPIEIENVIARAVELSSPLLEQCAHRLDVRVPLAGLVVSADVDRLAQVIANLLNNAARYTDSGGRIVISARRDRDEVLIAVSDNGIGVAEEMLPRIFEQFVRGPGAAERAQAGLGLGLSIVKTLTELHGGTVGADSQGLGRGTTFTVRLPSLPDDSVSPMHEPEQVAVARTENPQRILLVDDNVDEVEMLATILKAAGHDVQVAHDGPQALSIVVEFRPAVAVLDIGLPVMDGYELAERLRVELGTEVPYLIALSGYSEERDRTRSLAAGFARHFVKPTSADVLLQLIGEAR